MTTDDDRVTYLAREADGAGSPGDDSARPGTVEDESERGALDDLRALLADASVWDDPSPALEDAVVAAIGGARADGRLTVVTPAEPADGSTGGRTGTARRASRRRFGPVLAAAAALVVALAAGALVGQWTGGDDEPALAVELSPTDLGVGAEGTAAFNRTDSGWRIELDATGLPRRADGEFYEAWLRNADGVAVSIGTFNEGGDVVLWAGVPPTSFTTLSVTQEAADGDAASSGRVVLNGQVDAGD